MLFRECRLQTLHEIFKENNPTITIEKTFLAVGGIKASVYVMTDKGVRYLVPSGCADINTEMLCNAYHIEYKKVAIGSFINRYLSDEEYRNENVFIVPCSSTVLNVNSIEHIDKLMIGQSELVVDEIDVSEAKVYLKFNILEEKEYWIDLDILRTLSKVNIWLSDETTRIIQISKSDIKNSNELSTLLQKDNLHLLETCIVTYKKFIQEQIEVNCTFIQGLEAYYFVCNHFNKLLNLLVSEVDNTKKSNLVRYARFQLKYFHMFIISGSDGYYRNEFASTIDTVMNGTILSETAGLMDDWLKLSKMWRQFGRELGERLNQADDVQSTLRYLVRSFENITKYEVEIMEKLEKRMPEAITYS